MTATETHDRDHKGPGRGKVSLNADVDTQNGSIEDGWVGSGVIGGAERDLMV
jgi:hypothetical protein